MIPCPIQSNNENIDNTYKSFETQFEFVDS